MNKEEFLKIIKLQQEQNKRIDRLSELINFDSPLVEFGWIMFDKLIIASFNEKQVDWINWWLYERIGIIDGKEHPYWDAEGNEQYLHTPEDLWEFIKEIKCD